MNKKRICHPRHWILLAVLVAVLLLSACQAQPDRAATTPGRTSSPVPTTIPPILAGERPLPFRTISREAFSSLLTKTDYFTTSEFSVRSDFFVITSEAEIQKPRSQSADAELRLSHDVTVEVVRFGDAVMAELRAVDYRRDFVVLVFRRAGTIYPEPRLEITAVTRRADTVALYARFDSTPPKGGGPAADSFPYHLIAVSKGEEGEWGKDVRFILVLNEKEVSEHTHFVP